DESRGDGASARGLPRDDALNEKSLGSDRMRQRLKARKDLHLERVFETRSEAWERVGLAGDVSQRAVQRARRELLVLAPLLVGVLIVHHYKAQVFHYPRGKTPSWDTWVNLGTVLALLAL